MSAGRGIGRLSRQKSIMVVENNPFEAAEQNNTLALKVENLNHASLISNEELNALKKKMEAFP